MPGSYKISSMHFVYKNGSSADTNSETVTGQIAEDVRDGRISKIEITLQ